jgi:hypothetical protein
MRRFKVGVGLLSMIFASQALAGVRYTIDGLPAGGTAVPSSGVIDVGNIGASDTLMHVFDDSGVDDSVGMIKVRGSSAGGVLRVKVVDKDDISAFILGPQDPLLEGLRNLGGLKFVGINPADNSDDPTDTSLRDHAVVAVAVQGDITGDIDAGTIFRVDARRDAADTFGGTISGNITSHLPNGMLGSASVAYVRAGLEIAGKIEATGGVALSPANIDRIVAGAGGITGKIIANTGAIEVVSTVGPIGSTLIPAEISAKLSITEVATRPENDSDALLETPVHAIISADPTEGSTIFKVATRGDFNGEVHAKTLGLLYCASLSGSVTVERLVYGQFGSTPFPNTSAGIIVRGPCTAPITVTNDVYLSTILATSFSEPIVIGKHIKGAIIATGNSPANPITNDKATNDPNWGKIKSITIGYGDYTRFDPYISNQEGLTGIDNGFTGEPAINAQTIDEWLNVDPPDGSCKDGGIFAAREITGDAASGDCVKIYRLSRNFGGPGSKTRLPRIESPKIAKLQIDYFLDGVVWSGNLCGLAPGSSCSRDKLLDYSIIDDVQIGPMGPAAAIYFKSCPIARFSDDVYGRIALPRLAASEYVLIGKALDNICCGCTGSPFPSNFIPYQEDSPRGNDCAERGSILIQTPNELTGQIVLNAADQFHDFSLPWQGQVVVGSGSSTPIILGPSTFVSNPDLLAPYYRAPASIVGGGSIGVNRFTIHHRSCSPPQPLDSSNTPATVRLQSFLLTETPSPIAVQFYGPVRILPDTEALQIWLDDGSGDDPVDVSSLFRVTIDSTDARRVLIRPTPGSSASSFALSANTGAHNVYIVRRAAAAGLAATTQSVLTSSAQHVPADIEYRFRIIFDCNNNNTADPDDIALNPALDCNMNGKLDQCEDLADTNNNGIPDTCEMGCNGYPADFNGDTLKNIDDIFIYLNAWFAYSSSNAQCVDASLNGIVTIDDIFIFIKLWFSDCTGTRAACPSSTAE